ncbi:type I restriction enzyme HsdR N-terminal domain-containing protein [Herbaspirillum huttiense]|uniref:type I restriction enzyme HsdR N-terminal domain-containing protein n=1 Tax=Herbaspirillum huttiense TaxID=863372 RepID=UPI002176BC5F|nr:type I restriction enzyme HsdR N-terminal domain-containing protein [Herbaspirillum huttiense]UWE16425.1 type I restriction enzyme HsdR N-terminal domain-containing protein [Herbaspirillum huttiense]
MSIKGGFDLTVLHHGFFEISMALEHKIWQAPPLILETANEAQVETDFVSPLLAALGYEAEQISPKHPVIFRTGRRGRSNEADFAVFESGGRELANCLMVVEAKRPKESFADAQNQAESYAICLRSLVYVVTDGLRLEIWQTKMTARSVLVLSCDVKNLAANRAKVEALLCPASLLQYRNLFREPSLIDAVWNISTYLDAELLRLAHRPATISRRLAPVGSESTQQSLVDDCLDNLRQGCVITAHSGMGKTSVAMRLHLKALEAAGETVTAPIPVDVTLTELMASSKSLFEFALDRVVAHCNGLTRSMFIEIVQRRGIVIFCDAFDRVDEKHRLHLEATFKLVLRDYPLCRLFIFSRPSAIPRIGLPIFDLLPLNFDEQREIQKAIASAITEIEFPLPDIVSILPTFLMRISSSALIFSKVVEFYLRNCKLPTNLKEIFESWFDAIIPRADHKLTTYSVLQRGLTLIALNTWREPASVEKIAVALTAAALPIETLDQLQELGALHVSTNIELPHEALADYLRAKKVAEEIDNVGFSEEYLRYLLPDSFFPVLLLSLIPSTEKQSQLLRSFSNLGLRGYLEAVLYRAPAILDANFFEKPKLEKLVLSEIEEGFLGLGKAFFPDLLPRLIAMETGRFSDSISVQGHIDERFKWVNFQLVDESIKDADVQHKIVRQGTDEDLIGAARVWGIEVLHELLQELIACACIDGGIIWSEERVLTRLRSMIFCELDVPTTLDVGEQLIFWSKHRGEIAEILSGRKRYLVRTDEIYDDLKLLERSGLQHLSIWWNSEPEGNWWNRDWDGSDRALEQYYLRRDAAYSEIILNNFRAFGSDFKDFGAAPRAWKIYLRQMARRINLEELWDPVGSNEEVGVKIIRIPPDIVTHTLYDDWFKKTSEKLADFGRSVRSLTLRNGIAPKFDGRSLQGIRDGKTAVLRDVCRILRLEFSDIFHNVCGDSMVSPPFE